MLDADRHALSASVYHSALGIKERELVNLTNYLNNLGTQAALMFGFGLGMFAEVPESTPIVVSYVYYALATTCLGAEMYCLTNATLCTVLGPTLALNGPRGSMHAAVQGMYQERDWIWTSFAVGAVSFSFAMLVYIWVLLTQFGDGWDIGIAGMCTVIFIFCAVVVFRGIKRIFARFYFDMDPAGNSEQIKAEEYLKAQTAASMLTAPSSSRSK